MPMGPWIETDLDLDAAITTVRVNGRETLSFPTNSMIFGVAAYISRMSKYMTLYPGDVIWMGTEGTSENLKAGDIVDVHISGIGTLSNPLARASA
jgi:2-keto-4-pentenoate hydratase/2-oxohepta-3-ene-1,7-dioic acid hydratase in catechol pathway